ncbi:hypothetical protein BDB01DRAFT_782665 [Pilobolus umbonatus]|nr:hypothetical protein BDB01DRAFT_782665 [Pilobolus umbonatus]
MPSIVKDNTYEYLNHLITKYKHIVNNDPVAKCMIGYITASFIRNENTVDLDLVEDWLYSIELKNEAVHTVIDKQKDIVVDPSYQPLNKEENLNLLYDDSTDDEEATEDDIELDTGLSRYINHSSYQCDDYFTNQFVTLENPAISYGLSHL